MDENPTDTDPATLAKLALEDDDAEVRLNAVRQLEDDVVLMQAIEDDDWQVRKSAVERLSQAPDKFVELAIFDSAPEVRLAALSRLTDQNLLAEVAISAEDKVVAMAAMEGLSDKYALYRVAVFGREQDVGMAAVEALDDQAALRLVAIGQNPNLGNSLQDVQLAALHKLDDDAAALSYVAVFTSRTVVARAAVQRITNQKILDTLAHDDFGAIIEMCSRTMNSDEMKVGFEVAEHRSIGYDKFEVMLAAAQALSLARGGAESAIAQQVAAVRRTRGSAREKTDAQWLDKIDAVKDLRSNQHWLDFVIRTASDPGVLGIARLYRAMLDPHLGSFVTQVKFTVERQKVFEFYQEGVLLRNATGFNYTVGCQLGRSVQFKKKFPVDFPDKITKYRNQRDNVLFISTFIDPAKVLAELLRQPEFSDLDLEVLAKAAEHAELRKAAVLALEADAVDVRGPSN